MASLTHTLSLVWWGAQGIEIVERIPIPEELVPADAQVEITAKVFAGYNGGNVYQVDEEKLKSVKGRIE